MRPWVRLPTQWMKANGLIKFWWGKEGVGSDNVAALMELIAISHAVDDYGIARITYTDLGDITGLSRAKMAAGLNILRRNELINTNSHGKSQYELVNFGKPGWGKLPVRSMYSGGRIAAFDDFNLRKIAELDALKIYLLFVAFRGEDINAARIGYEKIAEYSGVHGNRIKSAISLLTNNDLIVLDQRKKENDPGYVFTYRIVGIDPRRHLGTTGREDIQAEAT